MAELDSGGIGGGSDDTSTGSEDEETERTRQSRDTSQLDPGDGGNSSTDSEMIGPAESPNRSVSSESTGESEAEEGNRAEPTEDESVETQRANQSQSLSTTTLGTTGTNQSRSRERTRRANQSQSFSTTTLGTSGAQSSPEAEKEPSQNQEQFGDIDYSFGLGGPGDEVESFVDEQIGDRGSEFVEENFSDPVSSFGEDLKDANLNFNAPDTVGPAQAAGNLAIGVANIAEEAPQIPAVGLEAVEGASYLLAGTPVAGGSEEEFDSRVAEAASFGQQALSAEVDRTKENPGEVAGEAAASFGVGKAIGFLGRATTGARVASGVDGSAARKTVDTFTPSSRSGSTVTDFFDSPDTSFVGDTRGKMEFGTKTKQKTIQKDSDARESESIEDLEEKGIVEIYNKDSDSTELSDVEQEARERLPEQEQFPSRSEFDRELEQMMRRVEKQEQTDAETTQDVEVDTEQDTATTAKQAAEANQPPGQNALESSTLASTSSALAVSSSAVAMDQTATTDTATETTQPTDVAVTQATDSQQTLEEDVALQAEAETTGLQDLAQSTQTTTTQQRLAAMDATQKTQATTTESQVIGKTDSDRKRDISLQFDGESDGMGSRPMDEFSKVFESGVASADEVLGEGESDTDGPLSKLEDT